MGNLILPNPETEQSRRARELCEGFVSDTVRPKYIMGRNIYVEPILQQMSIDGFIDDFAVAPTHLGKPIVKTDQVPKNARVLIASGGKPMTAKKRLDKAGLEAVDYFSFYKWSGLALRDVAFNEGFAEEFSANYSRFQWIYGLLADDLSRGNLQRLLSFRLNYDLDLMAGFENREDVQYFEPFLDLKPGEVFVDVGAFDGYTSQEFAKRCPEYAAIHIFEPGPANIGACKARLANMRDVHIHPVGLSSTKQTLRFSQRGSSSCIDESGDVTIEVDRMDDALKTPVSLIKMDIEGGELDALEGAQRTIADSRPKLALSVYHTVNDFWKIPEKVLAVRDDYRIYLRHYTESIYETVMFFIPA